MAYISEDTGIRPEVLAGSVGTIVVYPKIDSRYTLAGTASYRIQNKSEVLAHGRVEPETFSAGTHDASVYRIPIDPLENGEDYSLTLRWTPTSGGSEQVEVIGFDAALSPLGSLLSLGDLIEMRPDIQADLIRLGQELGHTEPEEATDQMVGVLARQARNILSAYLQNRAHRDGRVRPSQLLDRDSVRRVEALWAMSALAQMLGGTSEGDNPESLFYQHWHRQAERAFYALRIRYEELPDTTAELRQTYGRVTPVRRIQG